MESFRLVLEKYQGFIYLIFTLLGTFTGIFWKEFANFIQGLLLPILAILLYSTFCQVKLLHLPRAFLNYKLILASLIGNFVIIPFFVSIILLPIDSLVIKIGIALVLLVPCTDWFVTFSYLGKADTRHAIALLPILLIFQLFLLPFYLFLFFPEVISISIEKEEVINTFLGLIILPLILAFLTQKWADSSIIVNKILNITVWFPVPLVSIVVFVIFSSQAYLIVELRNFLPLLTLIFSVFLVFALVTSKIISKAMNLTSLDGRVLAFNFGTRNSFLVLPIALSLPEELRVTATIVVYQSLIELFGMLLFIRFVPNKIFPY
ncbi:MAG: arsenic resistance protein [Brevinematia bacterium]